MCGNFDKISIIIPIYNKKEFLSQCLDSVCAQSYTNIEVICVDDGSTDGSQDILKKYAACDSRIKWHSLSRNMGVGVARNFGFENSTGKYVRFVDADDLLPKLSTEILYKNIKEYCSDAVQGQTLSQNRNLFPFSIDHLRFPYTYSPNLVQDDFALCVLPIFTHWNILFSRDFLEDSSFHYSDAKNGQDVFFLMNIYPYYNRFTLIKDKVYNYMYRKNSATTGKKDFLYFYNIYTIMPHFYNMAYRFKGLHTLDMCFLVSYLNYYPNDVLPKMSSSLYENQIADLLDIHASLLKKYNILQRIEDTRGTETAWRLMPGNMKEFLIRLENNEHKTSDLSFLWLDN